MSSASRLHGTVRRATLLVLAVLFTLGVVFLSPERMVEFVATAHGPTFLAVLFVVYVARPFLALPISVLTVFVGYRYGIVPGLAVALAGTVVTCLPPYLVARRLDADAGLLGRFADSGRAAFGTTGDLRGMVAARLSPAPGDAVSYGAGLSSVSLGSYVTGTLVGELPWTVAYVLLGRSMRSFSVEAVRVNPLVLVAFALVALSVVAKPAFDWLRQRRDL